MAEKSIWPNKKVNGWLNSLCMEKEIKTSLLLYAVWRGKKTQAFLLTYQKKINKKLMSPLPSEHQGWNAGKVPQPLRLLCSYRNYERLYG